MWIYATGVLRWPFLGVWQRVYEQWQRFVKLAGSAHTCIHGSYTSDTTKSFRVESQHWYHVVLLRSLICPQASRAMVITAAILESCLRHHAHTNLRLSNAKIWAEFFSVASNMDYQSWYHAYYSSRFGVRASA
jgi:hypothetical protein